MHETSVLRRRAEWVRATKQGYLWIVGCAVRVTEAVESGEPPNSRCGAFTIATKGSM